jgi:hypothetical protein
MMRWLDETSGDVKQAITGLRRQPGVVATVLAVLGTAIGLNATLFTVSGGRGLAALGWGGQSVQGRCACSCGIQVVVPRDCRRPTHAPSRQPRPR